MYREQGDIRTIIRLRKAISYLNYTIKSGYLRDQDNEYHPDLNAKELVRASRRLLVDALEIMERAV